MSSIERLGFIAFVGRLFLASTFAIAVPPKIVNFQGVLMTITDRGIPQTYAYIMLCGAILLLVCGSGFLVFNDKSGLGA